jgi:hypothetical protein
MLCVGATKSGTTWLYDHLAGHPDCHLRAIKELHYFDTLANGGFDRQIKVQSAFEAKLRNRLAVAKSPVITMAKHADVTEWLAILRQRALNMRDYLAYLSGGRGDKSLVADITPSYVLLPTETLRQMATMASDVRVVYLMRDPVARLWSHIRMVARRAVKSADALPDAAFALLDRILDGETTGATERGDYIGALTRLRDAVAPSRLKVMFQEEMLTGAGLASLSAFLGIRTIPADFGKRVHAGVDLAMRDDQKARTRALLRPQYDFVARHYPDLPANWRKNMGEGL